MRSSQVWMRSSQVWMRSSQLVKASGYQCQSRNSPGFDPSILRRSRIWGAADEAVLNNVYRNKKIYKKSPSLKFPCTKRPWTISSKERKNQRKKREAVEGCGAVGPCLENVEWEGEGLYGAGAWPHDDTLDPQPEKGGDIQIGRTDIDFLPNFEQTSCLISSDSTVCLNSCRQRAVGSQHFCE